MEGASYDAPAPGLWIYYPDRTLLQALGLSGPAILAANLGYLATATDSLIRGAEAVAAGDIYEGNLQIGDGLRSLGRSAAAIERYRIAIDAAWTAGWNEKAQFAEIRVAETEAEDVVRGGGTVDAAAAMLETIESRAATPAIREAAFRSRVNAWRWSAAHAQEIDAIARTLEGTTPGTPLHRVALELSGLRSPPEALTLLTPPSPLIGKMPVAIAVRDSRIKRVELWLDGKRVARAAPAPFRASIDVGPRLTQHRLDARGLDAAGSIVARHTVHLNLPEAYFTLDVLPPQVHPTQVIIEAVPVVGRARSIERVEFWVGSQQVETVRRPPWRISVPPGMGSFTRVVAWDATGDSREAFAFFDPASVGENVDVNLVEVLVNVEDSASRPIVDLAEHEFRIREKGASRNLRSARILSTEPLLLGLAVDRSKSLNGIMDQVVRSALEFASRATRGGEIFVVGFDHRAEMLQWKTADADAVRRRLADLEASGNTALREALLYSLMQYQNSSGNRVLVVLTDGVDTSSRYGESELQRIANEFGIPIYLVLFRTGEARADASRIGKLQSIATASGGRSFTLDSLDELDEIWRRIQLDVDTRYLLVYRTPLDPDQWRAIDVATSRDGARVRSVRGLTPSMSQ